MTATSSDARAFARLQLETSQLQQQLSTEKASLRALRSQHESELRSERARAKLLEASLRTQLREKPDTTSQRDIQTGNCAECAKLRNLHESELRRERSGHRGVEKALQSTVKELQQAVYAAEERGKRKCGECVRIKAACDAELRRDKVDRGKREAELIAQLKEAHRVRGAASRAEGCEGCEKHTRDVTRLKEAYKDLEIKLEKALEADRQKSHDLRLEHERHLSEIAHITRNTRTDTRKLLEELKTKDRIINQLRNKTTHRKWKSTSIENLQPRKQREIDKRLQTGSDANATVPDGDTVPVAAVAPGCEDVPRTPLSLRLNVQDELSPEHDMRNLTNDLEPVAEEDCDSAVSSAPSSLSPQPYPPSAPLSCYQSTNPIEIPAPAPLSQQQRWKTDVAYEGQDKEGPENELTMAKRQVRELEKALLVTRDNRPDRQLAVVNSALTERVKVLEGREASLHREISDLREQNELLEFRILELEECHDKWSLRSQCSPDTRDVWTDTESDSGVTSVSPGCSPPKWKLRSLAQDIPQVARDPGTDSTDVPCGDDALRRRLGRIAEEAADPEDRLCLLQVLALLQSLEMMSRPQGGAEQLAADILLAKAQLQTPREKPKVARAVAKVSPFTEVADDEGEETETPCKALQESGIFDTEPEVSSVGTQTEPEKASALDLSAEVRRLTEFRQSVGDKLLVASSSPEAKLVREVQFYRDRLDLVERKVSVLESSGDERTKLLADRLQREAALCAQVQELTARVARLQAETRRLEEERCELEEQENDTRLRCQRLEEEARALRQSRMAAKRKARDAKSNAANWEAMVTQYEQRNYELEERECELRHRLDVMECTTPAVLLFNMWKLVLEHPEADVRGLLQDRLEMIEGDPSTYQKTPCTCAAGSGSNPESFSSLQSDDIDAVKALQLVADRERALKRRVSELEQRERAYKDTLRQADDLWAEMETGYKRRISAAEQAEQSARDQLGRAKAQRNAELKRLNELEDGDRCLREKLRELEKKHSNLEVLHRRLTGELVEQRNANEMQRDRHAAELRGANQRAERLVKEVRCACSATVTAAGAVAEDAGRRADEANARLAAARKRETHLEVTCAELREEVDTLEARVTELRDDLRSQNAQHTRAIRDLTAEMDAERQGTFRRSPTSPTSQLAAEDVARLQQVSDQLAGAADAVAKCAPCSLRVCPVLKEAVQGLLTLCEMFGGLPQIQSQLQRLCPA